MIANLDNSANKSVKKVEQSRDDDILEHIQIIVRATK